MITDSPIFTLEQKRTIKTNLEKDFKSFEKHTEAAEAQRNKKPWIQSTELSDSIAKTSRRIDAITLSLKKTFSSFESGNVSGIGRNPEKIVMDIQEKASFLEPTSLLDAASCLDDDKYRTVDGRCNNIREPSFGATGIAMRRLAPPAYADGMYPTARNNIHIYRFC